MSYYVYIIANRPGGALYTDVTHNLAARGCPRRERACAGFRARDGAPRLVYYEEFPAVLEALARERVIRACSRDWKIRRIERQNPDWEDLTPPSGAMPSAQRPPQLSANLPPELQTHLRSRSRQSGIRRKPLALRYPVS